MSHNIGLIVMMIIAIILLFVAMVLSAMASSSAKKNCPDDGNSRTNAYHMSMYSAIVAGIAVFLISICLIIYIFRAPVAARVGHMAQAVQGYNARQPVRQQRRMPKARPFTPTATPFTEPEPQFFTPN